MRVNIANFYRLFDGAFRLVNMSAISKFTLTNKSRFVYVNVTYTMDAGDIPDGVDSRKIKVIVKGFDQISRIENI